MFNNGSEINGTDTWDTNTYYEQNDINMLNNNAAIMHALQASQLKWPVFGAASAPYSVWDFKRKDRAFYFFDGQLVRSRDFGNLHYGYVGSAAGFSSKTLHFFAGLVQEGDRNIIQTWSKTNFDDPEDYEMIQKGIDSYNKGQDFTVKTSSGGKFTLKAPNSNINSNSKNKKEDKKPKKRT